MSEVRVIKVKQSVLANNDARAAKLRGELKEKGVFLLNVMSSPGSGKTTLLVNLIKKLSKTLSIGVMEADMDASVDGETVKNETGVRTLQLNTSGECHLDAKMVSEGVESLGTDGLDLIILENIGNLVCPAEFDTGATKNLVLLSIPEGHDKPLKYPLMFTKADIVVFTKKDVLPYFPFSMDDAKAYIRKLNDHVSFFALDALHDDGVQEFADELLRLVKKYKAS